jgi:hypothetical protein
LNILPTSGTIASTGEDKNGLNLALVIYVFMGGILDFMDDNTNNLADGMKEFNIETEEYYEQTIRSEEDEWIESEEKPKKTKYDYIRIVLILTSCIISSLYDFMKFGFALMGLAILLFTITTFFMGAIKKFITEGDNCSLLFRATFFLRIMLFVFFIISLSLIFLTKRYDLNYSYWIAIISFLLIATIEIIESSLEDYRSRKNSSKLSKSLRIILNIFLFILWINSIGFIFHISLPNERSLVVIDQIEVPDELKVLQHDYNGLDTQELIYITPIIITDKTLLKQIAEELGNRRYTPMNIISALNYSKLERITENYYQLFLIYNEESTTNVFSSPFASITMIDNKLVFKEPSMHSNRWLLRNMINDYYYLELSEDTISKLNNYISSSNK